MHNNDHADWPEHHEPTYEQIRRAVERRGLCLNGLWGRGCAICEKKLNDAHH